MRKVILATGLCMVVASAAMAQTQGPTMRSLAVNELMSYGQQLYERGDYSGASKVFYHVLDLSAQQPQALQYLKKMGQFSPEVKLPSAVTAPTTSASVDISSAASIQKAIDRQDKVLEQLQQHVAQLQSTQMPVADVDTSKDDLQDISRQLRALHQSFERSGHDMRQLQEQLR